LCEGFVWLSLDAGNEATLPGYIFAFFA
jgi:hypothetical protein